MAATLQRSAQLGSAWGDIWNGTGERQKVDRDKCTGQYKNVENVERAFHILHYGLVLSWLDGVLLSRSNNTQMCVCTGRIWKDVASKEDSCFTYNLFYLGHNSRGKLPVLDHLMVETKVEASL